MTPNPTGGKLTKEIINEYREYLYQLSSDGEHPRMVDALCDMALESLKAPAVTPGECPECGGKGEFHNERKEPFYAGFNAALLTPSPSEKEKP